MTIVSQVGRPGSDGGERCQDGRLENRAFAAPGSASWSIGERGIRSVVPVSAIIST